MHEILSNNGGRICNPTSSLRPTVGQHTFVLLCKHVLSWFAVLLRQQQVVEFDYNVGKVSELHKVRGDDVDPVHPWPLSLNPGHDGGQVSGATKEEPLYQKANNCTNFCVTANILSVEFQFKLIPGPCKHALNIQGQVSVSVCFIVMAITLPNFNQLFLSCMSRKFVDKGLR